MAFELTTLVMIGTNYQVGVDDKLKYQTVHHQYGLLEDSSLSFADVISQLYSAEY